MRDGSIKKVHSRNTEDMVLTSKFKLVNNISELNNGQMYYTKGLNGKITMSTVFDVNGTEINYLPVMQKLVDLQLVYIIPDRTKSQIDNQQLNLL
jgi:hypothetical protein